MNQHEKRKRKHHLQHANPSNDGGDDNEGDIEANVGGDIGVPNTQNHNYSQNLKSAGSSSSLRSLRIMITKPFISSASKKRADDQERTLPFIAGTLYPITIILNIFAAQASTWSSTWYSNIPSTTPVHPVIIFILGIALFSGAVGNIALILRFLERRIVLWTQISIIAAIVQGVILELLAILYIILNHPDGEYGDYPVGLYSALASGAMAILGSLILVTDFLFTANFEKKGAGLSTNQRRLIVLVIFSSIFLSIMGFAFGALEGWGFTESVFFSVVTLTTSKFMHISETLKTQ
jgi:hypothetical protein